MIFIDANIPMYLVGRDHPHKTDSVVILERLTSERQRLVTSCQVFQEILHRYVHINRREAIDPAFDVLHAVVDDILVIEQSDVEDARSLVHGKPGLSARDAIHIAVMRRRQINQIVSFDTGFDGVVGITRIHQ